MAIYKEIKAADDNGYSTFYRLSNTADTVMVDNTTDDELRYSYDLLDEKPSINGVTLAGDKSLEDLGIIIPKKVSDLPNDALYVSENTTKLKNYYTNVTVDQLIASVRDSKVDKVEGKGLSTNDYTDAEKAIVAVAQENVIESVKVNGTVLPITAKSVNVLVPTKVSQLTNDKNYIDKEINNLTNYYTKTTVDDIIAQELASGLSTKVDKVEGKGLSTNDYTNEEKTKLAAIASGAEVNVQSDWNATGGDAFIKNKPNIPADVVDLTDNDGLLFDKDYDSLTHKPVLNLNGKTVKDASFYAPTTEGKAGQVLSYTGNGLAPTWITLPEVAPAEPTTIVLNGESTTAAEFYAPVTAGTEGWILQSRGQGAPTWIENPAITGFSNYLAKDNTEVYIPEGDYNPATKKYVDDTKTQIYSGQNIPSSTLGDNGDLFVLTD